MNELSQKTQSDIVERSKQLEFEVSLLRDAYFELEKVKKEFEEARAKDEAILESLGEGLIVTDKKRKVTVMNKAAEEMIGRSEKDVVGKQWPEVLGEDGVVREDEESISVEHLPIEQALITHKRITANEYQYRKANGSLFPTAVTAAPVVREGTVIGGVVVFRDITKEKEMEKAKSEFISIASHQLRTPLTGIQWVVERTLRKDKVSKKVKKTLQDVHVSVQRLNALVDALLNTSRLERGTMKMNPEPLEIVGFLREYIDGSSALANKKNLNVRFGKHPSHLIILIDKSAFYNIISSLVTNAIEYTSEEGLITVSVEQKARSFVLCIKDNGMGIPKDDQKTIFEKFTRGSNAALVKTDGTGLGLYITKRIVELVGGKIWFESHTKEVRTSGTQNAKKKKVKVSQGTTFFVELPIESKVRKKQKEKIAHVQTM